MPHIIQRPTFAFGVLIFISSSVCKEYYEEECGYAMPKVDIKEIALLGSVTVFFLAFYSNSCYTRFKQQYTTLKSIEGQMRTICILMRYKFHPQHEGMAPEKEDIARYKMMELLRYLGAAYYLLCAKLHIGEDRGEVNLEMAYSDAGVVTEEEMTILRQHQPSMQWFKCICWAFHVVQEAMEEDLCAKDDGRTIENEILTMRERMGAVASEAQMMVPLAYFHLINALTISTVLIFSYASSVAATDWRIFIVIWVAVSIGILGMREVAVQLAEPFGADDTDLPVVEYVVTTMRFLTKFLKTATARPRKNQHFNRAGLWTTELSHGTDKQKEAFHKAEASKDKEQANMDRQTLSRLVDAVRESGDLSEGH